MGLELININKKFGNKTLFDNFCFEFQDTGVYSLVGDSGIGKTTLLRMIAGLDTDYTGNIVGGGVGNVSVVFQEYRLFPTLSAIDNVIFANWDKKNNENTDRAANMLFDLGFSADEMHLKPGELSGGMKQRVSLARAFLKDAPILILDEATKELDRALVDKVHDIIKKESLKRTVIIVTHDPEEPNILEATKINLNECNESKIE